MKRILLFRPERCLMCLSCVLACQLEALGVDDPRDIARGSKPPRRLSMTLAGGTPWPERCRHCTQAPCAEACISGSIVRDEATAAVRHRPETCVGCGSCQLVCPFNAITRDETGECMTKCNLCPERRHPAVRRGVPDGRPRPRERPRRRCKEAEFRQGDDRGAWKWLIEK